MCMLLTCCTRTSFMTLAAENKGLCRRACLNVLPLFAYLREPHELVDVLRQIYHITIWCYHGNEALQRLQVQTVHLSVLVAMAGAAAAWREEPRWRTEMFSVSLCSGFNPIFADVRLSVFSCLARAQNKPVELLPEALQPHSCQHPPKIT